MRVKIVLLVFSCVALLISASARAQQAAPTQPPARLPYGMPISLADAKKVMAAAEAKARETSTPSGIVIVGPDGDPIYEEMMDNTNNANLMIAEKKAKSAALYRVPTQFWQDRMAQAAFIIALPEVMPVGGGIPLVSEGRIVGAIGSAGAPTSPGDIEVAQAGADALK